MALPFLIWIRVSLNVEVLVVYSTRDLAHAAAIGLELVVAFPASGSQYAFLVILILIPTSTTGRCIYETVNL